MKSTGLDAVRTLFNNSMTNLVSLILSIILQLWPIKFRVQNVRRMRLGTELGGLNIGQSVEYAIWLPLVGWGSIRAVFRGTYAIPQWRVTEFQREMDRDNSIDGSLHCPRQSHWLCRIWEKVKRSRKYDPPSEKR